MRSTLNLTVDQEMADFIGNHYGLIDPSSLVNKLFHEDMERKGIKVDPAIQKRMENSDILNEAEMFLDEDTHSG